MEQTQADIVARIRKRWLNIRQEGGFDDLEGWAIKEISDGKRVNFSTCNTFYIIMFARNQCASG